VRRDSDLSADRETGALLRSKVKSDMLLQPFRSTAHLTGRSALFDLGSLRARSTACFQVTDPVIP
jgi:hypothetical protein